jgi:hypothetical protein
MARVFRNCDVLDPKTKKHVQATHTHTHTHTLFLQSDVTRIKFGFNTLFLFQLPTVVCGIKLYRGSHAVENPYKFCAIVRGKTREMFYWIQST